MIKFKKLLYLLSICCTSSLSYAAPAWTVSIPNSYYDPSAPWGSRFKYTAILYMTEDSFKSNEPLNKSCSSSTPCYIQINTQQKGNPNKGFNPDPNIPNVQLTTEKTVGEALRTYFEKGIGNSYIYTVTASTAPDRTDEGVEWCGAMGISNARTGANYIVMNGGECANLPPQNVTCELLTENVDLNHGTISALNFDQPGYSNVVNGTFGVSCSETIEVLMSITSPDIDTSNNSTQATRINLKNDGSLVSNLSIDEKNFEIRTPVEIKGDEPRIFQVKSVLARGNSQPIEAGQFLSYAYVTIAFQ